MITGQLNTKWGDFPAGPGVKTVLPWQGAWVQSLVEELGSHMPLGQKNKTNPPQNTKWSLEPCIWHTMKVRDHRPVTISPERSQLQWGAELLSAVAGGTCNVRKPCRVNKCSHGWGGGGAATGCNLSAVPQWNLPFFSWIFRQCAAHNLQETVQLRVVALGNSEDLGKWQHDLLWETAIWSLESSPNPFTTGLDAGPQKLEPTLPAAGLWLKI